MRSLREKGAEWGVTLPSLAWLALFFVVPTIIVFGIAFHAPSADGGYSPGFTMETWHAVVRTPYKEIVWRTIWISAATTFACIVLSLPCAYAIARMRCNMRFSMRETCTWEVPMSRAIWAWVWDWK